MLLRRITILFASTASLLKPASTPSTTRLPAPRFIDLDIECAFDAFSFPAHPLCALDGHVKNGTARNPFWTAPFAIIRRGSEAVGHHRLASIPFDFETVGVVVNALGKMRGASWTELVPSLIGEVAKALLGFGLLKLRKGLGSGSGVLDTLDAFFASAALSRVIDVVVGALTALLAIARRKPWLSASFKFLVLSVWGVIVMALHAVPGLPSIFIASLEAVLSCSLLPPSGKGMGCMRVLLTEVVSETVAHCELALVLIGIHLRPAAFSIVSEGMVWAAIGSFLASYSAQALQKGLLLFSLGDQLIRRVPRAMVHLLVGCWICTAAVVSWRRRDAPRIRRKVISSIRAAFSCLKTLDYVYIVKSHTKMMAKLVVIYLRPAILPLVWDSIFYVAVGATILPYIYKAISCFSFRKGFRILRRALPYRVIVAHGEMLVVLAGVRLRPTDFHFASLGALSMTFLVFVIPHACKALSPSSLRKGFDASEPFLLECLWEAEGLSWIILTLIGLDLLPRPGHLILNELLCALAPDVSISFIMAIYEIFDPSRPARLPPLPRKKKRWHQAKKG
ncbi:hypothetical protein C8J57DRAFT_1491318 [Mycena rebaudengoi]|nr:hypothetical protein C8J57DRAFT_1491318 [Mycena rebaudengoi]